MADLLKGGGCLREGGVPVVQTPSVVFVSGGDSVSTVVEPLGCCVEQHLSDNGRDGYIARRRGFDGFKKSA